MKSSFWGKLLERVEHLGEDELRTYIVRLAKEKGFFETIFNTLQEGVVVLDREGEIQYTNRAARKLFALPKELASDDLISKYLKDLDWESLLSEGQAINRILEVSYPESRVLEFYLLPVEDAASDEGGFVAIFHDITQRHSAAEKAIESEKLSALTLLAAGVAHELGNPINSLNIHLQLMERDIRKAPKEIAEHLKESVEVARKEIDRLDAIINQFLKAVRPTLPEFQEVDFQRIVEDTLSMLKYEIEDRFLLVEKEIEETLPLVKGDEPQLKQAVYNVVRNAIQAMPERGILRVVGRVEGDFLVFGFYDNGPGIALEDLPHVAEPYYTTKTKGTGLGLMIVQRILREHGGEFQIESHPGRGTAVKLMLPLRRRQMRLLEGKQNL